MVHRNEDGALPCLAIRLEARELGREESELVINKGVLATLGGDDAAAGVEHIAVEADDGHEWGVEREVDARLRHNGAGQGGRIGRYLWAAGAEVGEERSERGNLGRRGTRTKDHAVVIA